MAATQQALLMVGGVTGPTDPDYAFAVLNMHMDGSDNGTTFTDELGHTVTVIGSTVTKTGQKKYGTASGYFGGTTPVGLTVSMPSNEFQFGSGTDYTIHLWVYPTAFTDYQHLFNTGVYNANQVSVRLNPSGKIEVFCGNGAVFFITGSSSLSTNTWAHIAVTRSGTTTRVFLNGTQDVSSTTTYSVDAGNAYIGHLNNSGSNVFPCLGYLDDVEVYKAKAVWTSNFTPRTYANPNS